MSEEDVPTLVEPEWLEERLDEPDLRVVDCTVDLTYNKETGEMEGQSGLDDWEESHIPGSMFVDLIEDLSKTDDPDYSFQLPAPKQFVAEMESVGIGDDTRVVAYDNARDDSSNEWAARFWWMLRVFGHNQVGVLNGGWKRWTNENRATTSETSSIPDVTFTPDFHPELVADKEEVLEYISDESDEDACVVNALGPDDYESFRIPNTKNVPSVGESAVIDTETNTYISENEIRGQFEEAGATEANKVVTHCGAGIAASSAALAAHVAGIENVAVYDGSLEEWRNDPDVPTISND
jgi:thiosulfate/3-mercaptopyruvate sulfurtransferase